MNKFLELLNKSEKTVIGVLSGTSIDAVDVVLLKIRGSGTYTKIKVVDFKSYLITKRLKEYILRCSSKKLIKVEEICKLNFILGNLFANSVKKIIYDNKLSAEDIDLIGSHGQTIYHIPLNKKLFGYKSKSTLQIGDPSVIANQTGITTIGDFRVADVAVNGDGAPLVPYLDFILFSNKDKNRAFLNIGGISNVTYLKKGSKQNEVIAFDTGPGNIVLDSLMKKLFNKRFDKDGRTCLKGKINDRLLKFLLSKDKFYKRNPPKSTGREYYDEDFINDILNKYSSLNSNDVIATATKYTAYTMFYNLKKFILDELIVSGGGANNHSLMIFLKEYFKGVDVKKIDGLGINSKNKEAVLFAVLANELISGNKTNMTSVTGSSKNVYLGKICIA